MLNDEEKRCEYQSLRDEIQTSLSEQRTLSTFTITLVVTVIGLVSQMNPIISELYLLLIIVCLLSSVKARNFKMSISRIAAYMIVRLEKKDGFYWETALNIYRADNDNKDNNEMEPDKQRKNTPRMILAVDALFRKILTMLETQEYTFMGTICVGLFFYTKIRIDRAQVQDIIWEMILCGILSIVVIALIAYTSNDYWNMDAEQIRNYEKTWSAILGIKKDT